MARLARWPVFNTRLLVIRCLIPTKTILARVGLVMRLKTQHAPCKCTWRAGMSFNHSVFEEGCWI